MKAPLSYMKITQGFSKNHRGIDLGWHDQHNRPVYACDDGIVIYNRFQKTGGYVIHLRHEFIENGKKVYYVSEYGHLLKDSQKVHEGDSVKKGQEIAKMGASGKTTGEHLHFGIYKGSKIVYSKDNWVDPCKYINIYKDQNGSLMTKLKINKTKTATGIPSEPLLVHNKPNFNDSSIVKGIGIYNGQEVEYYGTKNGMAIIDNCNKYYTSNKYIK